MLTGYIEKTGDLDLARANIRNIGLTLQATGAAGQDVGAMIADLSEKFDIKKPKELFETLDLLTNQGKAGAFTLQNLATMGERTTSAYAVMGRTGKGAVREMGAVLQMIRKSTGSAEQATTSFEALMRTFTDAQKRKLLTKAGIRLIDPEDPKRLRSITDLLKDIIRKTGGDTVKLNTLFSDAEAQKAVNLMAAQYKKTGDFAMLDSFMKQSSDGAGLLKDAFTGADRSAAKWQTVITALQNGVFDKLSGPISGAANIVGNVAPSTMDKAVGYGLGGAMLLGGLALGVKGHKMIKGLRGGKGIAAAIGSTTGSILGVQRVLVVNWPSSLGMGSGQLSYGFERAASKSSKLGRAVLGASRFSKLARLGRGFGKAVPYLGAGLVALDIGSAAMSGRKSAVGEAVGSAGGSVAGMAAGAAIGSVVPFIGTAIGAAIGGVLGSYGGGSIGHWLTTDNHKNNLSGEIKIKVDSDGRSRVSAAMNNRNVNTVVDQGVVMGGAL